MSEEARKHLSKADKVLGKLIKKIGVYELKPDPGSSPYQALFRSIVHQQLSGAAAGTIFGRVKALYPKRRFPLPEDILATSDEVLRGAGLSRAKIVALKDLSAKTLERIVPTSRAILKMSEPEIISRLTAIRGVGLWTVEMMLIFKMGRIDVLPATDYGVRKGFALIYGLPELPKPADLLAHGEIWRPYRSIATWYLWRALDQK